MNALKFYLKISICKQPSDCAILSAVNTVSKVVATCLHNQSRLSSMDFNVGLVVKFNFSVSLINNAKVYIMATAYDFYHFHLLGGEIKRKLLCNIDFTISLILSVLLKTFAQLTAYAFAFVFYNDSITQCLRHHNDV